MKPATPSFAFSPDAKRLASTSDELKVWDVATGRLLQTFAGSGMSVAFVDGGTSVLSEVGSVARRWRVPRG